MTNISLSPQDLTFESRVKRATDELTRIATDQSDSKILLSATNPAQNQADDLTHSDLRKLLLKILANKDIMDVSTL